jgi:hypothetical protein
VYSAQLTSYMMHVCVIVTVDSVRLCEMCFLVVHVFVEMFHVSLISPTKAESVAYVEKCLILMCLDCTV